MFVPPPPPSRRMSPVSAANSTAPSSPPRPPHPPRPPRPPRTPHPPHPPHPPHLPSHPPAALLRVRHAIANHRPDAAVALLRAHPTLALPDVLANELAFQLRSRAGGPRPARIDSALRLLSVRVASTFDARRLARAGRVADSIRALEHATHPSPCVLEDVLRAAARGAQMSNAAYVLYELFPRFGLAPRVAAFAAFIQACGRAGNLARALDVRTHPAFPQLPPHDQTVVYERLMDACVRCRMWRQARELLTDMIHHAVPRTQRLYDCLLSSSGNSQFVDDTLALMAQMRVDGFSSQSISTYNALIRGASRAGKFNQAIKVYSTLCDSHLVPNLDTYNAVLSSCARAISPQHAFNVLADMRRQPDVSPNAVSYNWVVKACSRAGDVHRAFQVAQTMQQEGIHINIVTYNNLLQACCNAGRLERAFAMVKQVVQKKGIQPNSHTYDTLIQGCGRWGQLDAALRLFDSMRQAAVDPTIITYSVTIDACARAGAAVSVHRAFELFDQMKADGLEPNLITFNSLIHVCARAKRSDLAFRAFDLMKHAGVTPDIVTLCSLVDACGRSGHVQRAFEVMYELPRDVPSIIPNVPAYNALIHACLRAGDFVRMSQARNAMHMRGLRPNVVTYSTLISAYAATGQIDIANNYLEQMQKNGLRPNKLTYTSIISGYGRVGNVDSAMEMLEQSRCMLGQPDEELYTAAIVAAIGGNRKEAALKLAADMGLAGYIVPSVFNKMMRQVGEVERSASELRSMLVAMEALNIRPQRAALESLIEVYGEEGNVDASFDMIPDMRRLGYPPNLQTYRRLIQACALSKDAVHIRRARALFRKLRTRFQQGDARLRSHYWLELYEAIIRAVQQVEAQEERYNLLSRLFQSMANDCGESNAWSLANRVCPEFAKQNLTLSETTLETPFANAWEE